VQLYSSLPSVPEKRKNSALIRQAKTNVKSQIYIETKANNKPGVSNRGRTGIFFSVTETWRKLFEKHETHRTA